jgi:hypothetical protein
MTMKKTFLINSIFLLSLISIRLVWVFLTAPQEHRNAVHGQIDLRDWDFSSDQALSLNGQWEFYPHHFLNPSQETMDVNQEKIMLQVPGHWSDALSNKKDPMFGYGSYRLKIQVTPDKDRLYAIRMPSIPSSSELLVNGRLLANAGIPTSNADSYTARNVPYTASFTTDRSEIEIVILLIVSTIITILIDDDRLLLVWLPIAYEWMYKLYYLSFLGVALFLSHYACQLMPEEFSDRSRKGLWIYSIACP